MSSSDKSSFRLPKLPPETFFNMVSIGVHALILGLVLPKIAGISVTEAPYQEKDIVPVIELNALEQTRLPSSSSLLEQIPATSATTSYNQLPNTGDRSFVPSLAPPPPPPQPQMVYVPPPLPTLPPVASEEPPKPKNQVTPAPASSATPETLKETPTAIASTTSEPKDPEVQKKLVATRQKSLLDSIAEKAKLLQHDTTNTTEEEAKTNYTNWLAKIQAQTASELELPGSYPKDACIKKLEGTSVYGVLVDSQGKVTESELIRSAGYGIFNQQALELIQKTTFDNATGGNLPYQVSVKFAYDQQVCPSLSVTNLQKGPKPPSGE